ncbi:MAG: hypothetical protein ACJAXJ_003559, partial [Colwellia sp.]
FVLFELNIEQLIFGFSMFLIPRQISNRVTYCKYVN